MWLLQSLVHSYDGQMSFIYTMMNLTCSSLVAFVHLIMDHQVGFNLRLSYVDETFGECYC